MSSTSPARINTPNNGRQSAPPPTPGQPRRPADPCSLNRRTRQLGAAIIGYLGAFSILAAIRWTAEADPEWFWRWALDWRLLFVIAGVGALIRAGLVDVIDQPRQINANTRNDK